MISTIIKGNTITNTNFFVDKKTDRLQIQEDGIANYPHSVAIKSFNTYDEKHAFDAPKLGRLERLRFVPLKIHTTEDGQEVDIWVKVNINSLAKRFHLDKKFIRENAGNTIEEVLKLSEDLVVEEVEEITADKPVDMEAERENAITQEVEGDGAISVEKEGERGHAPIDEESISETPAEETIDFPKQLLQIRDFISKAKEEGPLKGRKENLKTAKKLIESLETSIRGRERISAEARTEIKPLDKVASSDDIALAEIQSLKKEIKKSIIQFSVFERHLTVADYARGCIAALERFQTGIGEKLLNLQYVADSSAEQHLSQLKDAILKYDTTQQGDRDKYTGVREPLEKIIVLLETEALGKIAKAADEREAMQEEMDFQKQEGPIQEKPKDEMHVLILNLKAIHDFFEIAAELVDAPAKQEKPPTEQ